MTPSFTPVSGLIGGAMIGLSAVLLLATLGRLAGISNLALGLVRAWLPGASDAQWPWRLAFIAGMIASTCAYFALTGQAVHHRSGMSPALLIAAGLLVGYGTSLGNGCTSGHGVCGLGRLSLRSLLATLAFMATGALTVFVVRHVLPQ